MFDEKFSLISSSRINNVTGIFFLKNVIILKKKSYQRMTDVRIIYYTYIDMLIAKKSYQFRIVKARPNEKRKPCSHQTAEHRASHRPNR